MPVGGKRARWGPEMSTEPKISDKSTEQRLAELLAKDEIRDVVYRYARGIDRLDFDLVRSCYHPGAYDDHGTIQGDVEALLTGAGGFLKRCASTMHFMGNLLIEIDDVAEGGTAKVETYAIAYHRLENSDGSGKDDVFGLRYVDRFENRDGQWLIAHRVIATEWRRVDPLPVGKIRGGAGEWGTRDGNDVIDWIMTAKAPAS